MRHVVTIGSELRGGIPVLCKHEFVATADGQLAHVIDDQLRAIVPPEGWDDYVQSWPDAAPVVLELRPSPAIVPPPPPPFQ